MSKDTDKINNQLAPPLTRANQLIPIIEYLQSLGVPWENILKRSKLPVNISDKPNALIPELCVRDVIIQAGEYLSVENIGFEIGQNMPRLPPLTFDNNVKNLQQALESFCDTMHIYASNTVFSLQLNNSGAWFCRVDPLDAPGTRVIFEQYMISAFIRVVQNILGDNQWQPSHIRFNYIGPENLEGFNCNHSEITFDQTHTALFIDQNTLATLVNRKYIKANPVLNRMDNLDNMDIIHGIEEIFCSYFDSEIINGDFISTAMLSTPRNLQRKLEQQGTSFRKIRNSLLYREAKILLTENSRSITEISALLGYSSPPHFTRAFTNWSGETPAHYRENRKTNVPD